MTIADWCKEHSDVVVTIMNPRVESGYETDIWMEDMGHRYEIKHEVTGREPASESRICAELEVMYQELKDEMRVD